MRTRIQLTKAQAARPAARPGPAPPAAPAARALQAAEDRARLEEMARMAQLVEDRGVLLREPPLYERMPDPATLPGLREIGIMKLPVYVNTKDGMNAARLDAEFDDARFGVRFRDQETRRKVAYQIAQHEPRHARTNLYSLFGEKAGPAATRGNQAPAPTRLKMRDMFRPGEEPKRKQVPIRVVVIDSAGKNPPVDVAVLVGRNDLVSHLVQGIRTKLAIPVKEKIVLASVQFKHYDEKRQHKPGLQFQGCSKVNVLYTCATDKDGKVLAEANQTARNPDPALPFDKRAVQGVIGFSREVPSESPVNLDALTRDYVENRSSNAKAAKLNDPVQPDDVLVAYRLPENTADVVVVYPCYHDDITKVKAEAQEAKKRKLETQKRVEKIKEARKEARRADPYYDSDDSDNPYYDSSDEDMEHDLNEFADENRTWIKPFSFPLIMPVPKDGVRDVTNIPRDGKEIEVGGEVPAAALASTLKNIISHCIKDGSDKPENAQAKGKRKAPVDSINLPVPLLLHTGQDYQNPIRQVDCSAFEELYAGDKHSAFANLNYKHHHRKFDPKSTRFNYGVHAFQNSGFRMHQIIAVYNHGALSTSAKKAFTAPLDIFRAGAVRHQTAEEDEKDLPNLYRRQCAEHAAAARAERILLELKCASFACFDVLPRPT